MKKVIIAIVSLSILLIASMAVAAIPHSTTGVISSCYNNSNGSVRIIDRESGAECNSNETLLEWDSSNSSIVYAFNTFSVTDSGQTTGFSFPCPQGTQITGGGYGLQAAGGGLQLSDIEVIEAAFYESGAGFYNVTVVMPGNTGGLGSAQVHARVSCLK